MPESRLFVEAPLSGGRLELDRGQAHYVGRVLRKRVGDRLTLFDGSGREFPAEITAFAKDRAVLEVGDARERDCESPLEICLLQSVSKGERMDFAIQKATELGVTGIQPVTSERTVVRLDGERAGRRTEHWQRIAASACEQCGRNRVPRIYDTLPLGELLAGPSSAALRVVLAPGAETGLGKLPPPGAGGIEVLVGPEGGFSGAEIDDAVRSGFVACHVGPRVLRAETAGPAALAAMQAMWGDF